MTAAGGWRSGCRHNLCVCLDRLEPLLKEGRKGWERKTQIDFSSGNMAFSHSPSFLSRKGIAVFLGFIATVSLCILLCVLTIRGGVWAGKKESWKHETLNKQQKGDEGCKQNMHQVWWGIKKAGGRFDYKNSSSSHFFVLASPSSSFMLL